MIFCNDLYNFIVATVGRNPITLACKRTLHLWHCALQLRTVSLLQKRSVISPTMLHHGNSLSFRTCLRSNKRVLHAHQIFVSMGKKKSCIPIPFMGHWNPLYSRKLVHFFIELNNETVCCMKNQNNFPFYGRILSLQKPPFSDVGIQSLFMMDVCGINLVLQELQWKGEEKTCEQGRSDGWASSSGMVLVNYEIDMNFSILRLVVSSRALHWTILRLADKVDEARQV